MRGLIVGIALVLAGGVAAAPEPTGLDAIAAYAGQWKAEIHHVDSAYGKAGVEAYTLRNDCWRSAGYYVCDQFVDGDSKALLVFIYDAKSGSYTSYPITQGSGDAVHGGKLLIAGKVWTYPWESTEKGKTVQFRVVNTWKSNDLIDFRQEYSADGGAHWTVMAEGIESRIK